MRTQRLIAIGGCLLALALAAPSSLIQAQIAAQENTATPARLQDYAGKWHWMAKGQPFATMTLELRDGQILGTLTNATFDVDEEGRPSNALARPGTTNIVRSAIENGVLHLWGKDGSDETEWKMRLVDSNTADLLPLGAGAPSLKQGIRAERIQ